VQIGARKQTHTGSVRAGAEGVEPISLESDPPPTFDLQLRMLAAEYVDAELFDVAVVDAVPTLPLPDSTEAALFAIADAMLRAALASGAENVEVEFKRSPTATLLAVRHDGGPHLASAGAGDLHWIEMLVEEVGGSLIAQPQSGGGVRLIAEIASP
jgi:hypothetical protein